LDFPGTQLACASASCTWTTGVPGPVWCPGHWRPACLECGPAGGSLCCVPGWTLRGHGTAWRSHPDSTALAPVARPSPALASRDALQNTRFDFSSYVFYDYSSTYRPVTQIR
jgi:hypothetical protein